jgi:hypothetical protein
MTPAASIPSGLLIYGIISGLLSSARNAKVKTIGSAKVFDAKPTLKALIILAAFGFAIGSFFVLFIRPPSWPGAILFACLSLCGIVGFPNPIILTAERIEEVKWWGRQTSIRWSDVERVEFHKGPTTTVVVAKNGKKISHSGFHAATEQFREECSRLSHHQILIKEF